MASCQWLGHHIAMAFLDLLDASDLVEPVVRGWRYLLSRTYRLKKHREWRDDWLSAFFEILFGLLSIVLSLGLVGLVAYFLWPGVQP